MRKIFVFTALFIVFSSASYGQQLMKINSAPAYDNVNHDQQRTQQLSPLSHAKYALIENNSYYPPAPIVKLSQSLPVDMLNSQKIRIDRVPDYVGKSTEKNK